MRLDRIGALPQGVAIDAQDADGAVKRQRDDLARAHFLGWFEDALAVDADVAGVDQPLREGAAFDQPDAVQEAVDAQRLALEVGQSGEGIVRA